LIDSIISASRTPYSAFHDIDANKPGGSIQIRVKTYAHRLSLYQEELSDLAARRSELEKRVEAKRQELLRSRNLQFRKAALGNESTHEELMQMQAAYQEYLEEEPVHPSFSGKAARHADVGPPAPIGFQMSPHPSTSLLQIQTKPLSRRKAHKRIMADPTERISP